MAQPSTAPPRGGRTLLALWGFIAALGFAGAALLCSVSSEVAGSAVFGSPGTQAVLAVALLMTLAGTVVAWRPAGFPVRVRQFAVLLLAVVSGATTVVAVGFFAGGEWADVGILLLQSAVFAAVIATRISRLSTVRASGLERHVAGDPGQASANPAAGRTAE
ncbi:hypothetical protein GCM10022251_74230 [Phytohabitans flavus]|uniref:Integral membrane protein n=1 Tax=Phytohabitans flavus TaxID=1076124 RepID=A0A6F8XL39_9ACTN|nr:hypothetical protein [Phytohabitans flavus]BCB74501.1 hypothetical protein Pflav_009110 [Phytohabitans flavus]